MKMFCTYFKIITLILIAGRMYDVKAKECYICEGINCLRTSKVTNKATCLDPVDNCVTVFNGLTVIVRDCYSKLPEEYRKKCDSMSDSGCHKCYTDLCNDRGATSCLQCDSKTNKDCSSAAANLKSTRCPVSTSPNSYCYFRKSSAFIERGCLVDSSEQLKCLSDSSCEMCIPDSEEACNRESTGDINSGCKCVTTYSILILLTCFIITIF